MRLKLYKALVATLTMLTIAPVNGTMLTFSGTYNSKYYYVGSEVQQELNFAPLIFNFTVNFDPQVTQLLGPTISSGSYTGSNGNLVNYISATANTGFGTPSFSESPVSDSLGVSLSIAPSMGDYSQSSENESFYWASEYPFGGSKSIGFTFNYQGYPTNGSPDSAVYYMEVYSYVPHPPANISEVGHIQTSELMNYLTQARDQKIDWHMDEAGQYLIAGNINARSGSHYFGSATLITIDGIATPVPEPETYAMFMAGLGLMGFIARRRKNNQV